jgi:hypothetical protein
VFSTFFLVRQLPSPNKAHGEFVIKNASMPLYDNLWIYGDSQARRMYAEIRNTKLCGRIFKACNLSRNWVYAYTGEFPPQDNLDFDHNRIVDDVRRVLALPEMSQNSVMVLNLGLHYLQTTSFSNYVKLLRGVVDVFKARMREGKKCARMIWKTTTEISKHKDTSELLYLDFKRFLNNAVSFDVIMVDGILGLSHILHTEFTDVLRFPKGCISILTISKLNLNVFPKTKPS